MRLLLKPRYQLDGTYQAQVRQQGQLGQQAAQVGLDQFEELRLAQCSLREEAYLRLDQGYEGMLEEACVLKREQKDLVLEVRTKTKMSAQDYDPDEDERPSPRPGGDQVQVSWT